MIEENTYEYADFEINLSVYKCDYLSGEMKKTEHQELMWVDARELDSLDWAEADRPIVETLIDSLPVDITDEVTYDYFETKAVEPTDRDAKRAAQDYEASQKRKKASGATAESAVIRYEKDKLNNMGRPDLSDMVKQVSKDSDDYGYDVLSFSISNGIVSETHIEVKSAKLSSDYIEFFISAHELRKFRSDKVYKVYCLFKNGRSYKLHEINKADFFKNASLSPFAYRVRIRIAK
jgi:hypothetical protein